LTVEMWAGLPSGFLAIIATLLGTYLGGRVANNSQRKHYRLAGQSEACASLLKEYSRVYLQLLSAARQSDRKPESETTKWVDWAPWNQAISVVNLTCNSEIVQAAHGLDAAFWEVSLALMQGKLDQQRWHNWAALPENAKLKFTNVVRSQLGYAQQPLSKLSGRPPLPQATTFLNESTMIGERHGE